MAAGSIDYGQGVPQATVTPSAHLVSLPPTHELNAQPPALLLLQVSVQCAAGSQVTAWQALPPQSKWQVLPAWQ